MKNASCVCCTCTFVLRAGSVAYMFGKEPYDERNEPNVGDNGYCVGDMAVFCRKQS